MAKKDKSQITTGKQLRQVFFAHLRSILLIFFIGFLLFASLWTINIVDTIMGFIMLFIYGCSLYSAAFACADYDLKSYAKTKSYPYKGVVLSISIIISNFIVWALMKFLWTLNPGETLTEIPAIIGHFLFIIWTFPYNAFMNLQRSDITLIGHILMYAFPPVFAGLGYFARLKNFDIFSKLDRFVYEKANDKNKAKSNKAQ